MTGGSASDQAGLSNEPDFYSQMDFTPGSIDGERDGFFASCKRKASAVAQGQSVCSSQRRQQTSCFCQLSVELNDFQFGSGDLAEKPLNKLTQFYPWITSHMRARGGCVCHRYVG